MFDRINIKELRPNLYLLDDAGEATGYLLIGNERALVIDTMNGYADVKEACRSITDKPLTVVNTHGHCDHIYGNVYFDEPCLMSPLDMEVAKRHMQDPGFVEVCQCYGLEMPPFAPLNEGDIIDLGGITVEAISVPGHTPGSMVLLDREERILFTGDAINRHLWMQLPESLPIRTLAENLDKVMYLKDRADYICHGHAQDFDPISLLQELRDAAWDLVTTEKKNDPPYEWFQGISRKHPFPHGSGVICHGEPEIFRIHVKLFGIQEVKGKNTTIRMLPFGGTWEGFGMKGGILPGGVDTQTIDADGEGCLSARYMLQGEDEEGNVIHFYVDNSAKLGEELTHPKVICDDPRLQWLDDEPLYGNLTGAEGGVLIKIYRDYSRGEDR